jgi:phage gp46-like protein
MLVDRKIGFVTESDASADIEFVYADSLYNNIWISIMTPKGFRFNDPTFGSRMYELKANYKRNERSLNYAKMWVEESLRWIVETGLIIAAKVTATFNDEIKTRINLDIEVTKSNKQQITYALWYDVV